MVDQKFTDAIDIVRRAFEVMAEQEIEGNLAELLENAKPDEGLSSAVIGQFLMEVLPFPNSTFEVEAKAHWMRVAEYLGPDWIAEFRRVGAFMDKVENFR